MQLPASRNLESSYQRMTVLITGASRGIGRATAIEFARQCDTNLILVARNKNELAETQKLADRARPQDYLGTSHCIVCDLTRVDQIESLCTEVKSLSSALDVLINNAGVGSSSSFSDSQALIDIDRLLALNVRAPMIITHRLLPELREGAATIVNISSVAGLVGVPDAPIYSATKWALTGFSEAIRAQLSKDKIRVVCIQPGPVPTPGWPHVKLSSRPLLRRIFATDTETIARCCVRAAIGRGSVAPVRPRIFQTIPMLRALAPWMLRRTLQQSTKLIPTTTDGKSNR